MVVDERISEKGLCELEIRYHRVIFWGNDPVRKYAQAYNTQLAYDSAIAPIITCSRVPPVGNT